MNVQETKPTKYSIDALLQLRHNRRTYIDKEIYGILKSSTSFINQTIDGEYYNQRPVHQPMMFMNYNPQCTYQPGWWVRSDNFVKQLPLGVRIVKLEPGVLVPHGVIRISLVDPMCFQENIPPIKSERVHLKKQSIPKVKATKNGYFESIREKEIESVHHNSTVSTFFATNTSNEVPNEINSNIIGNNENTYNSCLTTNTNDQENSNDDESTLNSSCDSYNIQIQLPKQ